MIRYYKPSSLSSTKIINYLKFLYISIIIIVTLSSFYTFTSPLADAQKTSNTTEIDTLLDIANTLFNKKNYDEAIPYYDKILAINASEINALNHKGITLWALHKYNESLPYFDQILAIN